LSYGQNTPDSRLTHSPSLHLPGGLNFDPPGSTHCWCSQSSPESSAGNTKQSALPLKQVNALIAKLGRVRAGLRPMDRAACTTCELGVEGTISGQGAGGGFSGLSGGGDTNGGT